MRWKTAEATCYDYLLSYSNQRYQQSLDRHQALPFLLALRDVQGPESWPAVVGGESRCVRDGAVRGKVTERRLREGTGRRLRSAAKDGGVPLARSRRPGSTRGRRSGAHHQFFGMAASALYAGRGEKSLRSTPKPHFSSDDGTLAWKFRFQMKMAPSQG